MALKKSFSSLQAILISSAFFFPNFSSAADHVNLEEGLPVEIADTIPIHYRNTELQGLARWTHTREGEEKFSLEPRLEYGIWYNAQASVSFPYEFGEAVDENEFKDIDLELFYNFNQETLVLPAVALAGVVIFPVSDEGEGVDTALKLLMSKTIGGSTLFHRVHLNAAWNQNDDALEDERDDFFKIVMGYDRLLNARTQLVLDYVWEQEKEDNKEANIIEAGLRYQFTPLTVIAAGVGAGVGADSPDLRITLAFQHSFNGWY